MGVDFDILEHCKKVRADHGPPYTCPLEKCGRPYKSMFGLQYHLKSYDHDNPTPLPRPPPTHSTPRNKKGRARSKHNSAALVAQNQPAQPEPLTFEEAQKMVQFDVNGISIRWNITEPLPVMQMDQLKEEMVTEDDANNKPNSLQCQMQEALAKLPQASFKELDDYNICDAPARPNSYIRFIEKSAEELDGEVEYDVDEEDTTWLALMSEKRSATGLSAVSVDSLELLMDRLEKESYFQATVSGQSGAVVDDDAVCCICMDGECQNTNVILFCDMCNLAVHQDCYGVPYIPEGQWLCRRCLQSPSRAVDCVLCPNQSGAFKQTDHGQWAHVVCALWIPEVRFANTVFLEPIDSIETIPAARWRLICYLCKQKGVGACIQCHKSNCYSAFHVTCAQQSGLYMKMDTVENNAVIGNGSSAIKSGGGGSGVGGASNSAGSASSAAFGGGGGAASIATQSMTQSNSGNDHTQPVVVQKIAYCDTHSPIANDSTKKQQSTSAAQKNSAATPQRQQLHPSNATAAAAAAAAQAATANRVKRARKMLAKKRNVSAPVILIPTIPPDRIHEIGTMVSITKKSQFIQRLIAYWTLKRHFRNGVPLLRRLQSSQQANCSISVSSKSGAAGGAGASGRLGLVGGWAARTNGAQLYSHVDTTELCRQLKYWQCLRQDLERARLLCELVRKREKLKLELTRVTERGLLAQLAPVETTLRLVFNQIRAKDTHEIFTEPVDVEEVPDYMSVVTEPMDLSTMETKLNANAYTNLDQLEKDFALMIANCLAYNNRDTVFYRAAIKMRDQCGPIFRAARNYLASLDDTNCFDQLPDSKAIYLDVKAAEYLQTSTTNQTSSTFQSEKNEKKNVSIKEKESNDQLLESGKSVQHSKKESARTKRRQSSTRSNAFSKVEKPPTENVAEMRLRSSSFEKASKLSEAGAGAHASTKAIATTTNRMSGAIITNTDTTNVVTTTNANSLPSTPPTETKSPTVGVNRRTAVLFTRKAQAALKKPTAITTATTGTAATPSTSVEGSPAESSKSIVGISSPMENKETNRPQLRSNAVSIASNSLSAELNAKGATCAGGKFSHSTAKTATDKATLAMGEPSATRRRTKGANTEGDKTLLKAITSSMPNKKEDPKTNETQFATDSFKVYRCDSLMQDDDEQSASESSMSTCYSRNASEVESDESETSDQQQQQQQQPLVVCEDVVAMDEECKTNDSTTAKGKKGGKPDEEKRIPCAPISGVNDQKIDAHHNNNNNNNNNNADVPTLKPLQLVWAKTRGYPWYPALIVNPTTTKGFVYKGLTISSPPDEVMSLAHNHTEQVYLVQFFDAKRTWQWLPRDKLEQLGVDDSIDDAKMNGPRKPTLKKAVRKAFQEIQHCIQQTKLKGNAGKNSRS